MAITPRTRIDKQDREKYLKELQGATPNKAIDTQDLEKYIKLMETQEAVTPLHIKVNNEDMEKAIRDTQAST